MDNTDGISIVGKNYKIGQDYNAQKLTSNDCIEIMNKKNKISK